MTIDAILTRIEAFNQAHGGGVLATANRGLITLTYEETGAPIARLRPVGEGDQFNILYWSMRGRWSTIGDFGGVILSLDDALDYIASESIFWNNI